MANIIQLSPHIANLIAAGEVVERPASVVKELVENAVDAGATKITVELRGGGMTFMRVTDNGCGMSREDAKTAFLRHATSKLRCAEDLGAIGTMGFRGEALAAISSVSRIDLLTKTRGEVEGVSLHLEAGTITQESEAGCPEGTTIIIRDLFFNTPARMKFMKQDSVEAGAAAGTIQRQALAHPEVAIRFLRDGKEILNTPGDGQLLSAMAGVYGREAAAMVPVESHWEKNTVTGFVSKPTQARPSRTHQVFFVNGRPVKSKLLQSALEEAYRNQMMVGKFPACVLHLQLPPNRVDVNVHPAKTEVKFLSEREAFDCIHYGVLAALNKTQDRPDLHLGKASGAVSPEPRTESTFRTMTVPQYKEFTKLLNHAPKPEPRQAQATLEALRLSQPVTVPTVKSTPVEIPPTTFVKNSPVSSSLLSEQEPVNTGWIPTDEPAASPVIIPDEVPKANPEEPSAQITPPEPPVKVPEIPRIPEESETSEESEQVALPMPEALPFTILGELFRAYIVVQQGDDAFLIDKHAAHERILFEKLRAQKHEIASQSLLDPQVCRLGAESTAEILAQKALVEELGYEVEEFGEGTLLLRQIPMDVTPSQASECLADLAQALLSGCPEDRDTIRDNVLHTMACKAAIKAGWHTDPLEREALVRQVLSREDLKYCPHGRPICIHLSRQMLERQFGRA